MFDIDKVPENDEERIQLLQIVKNQSKELAVLTGMKVTCYCGKRINVYHHAYRCYFCGIYFCRKCAARHFNKVIEEEDWRFQDRIKELEKECQDRKDIEDSLQKEIKRRDGEVKELESQLKNILKDNEYL